MLRKALPRFEHVKASWVNEALRIAKPWNGNVALRKTRSEALLTISCAIGSAVPQTFPTTCSLRLHSAFAPGAVDVALSHCSMPV